MIIPSALYCSVNVFEILALLFGFHLNSYAFKLVPTSSTNSLITMVFCDYNHFLLCFFGVSDVRM